MSKVNKESQTYPGVQTDIADDNRTSRPLTKQETELLNNNPRTQGE